MPEEGVVELRCKPYEGLHSSGWWSFTGWPSGGHWNVDKEVDDAVSHISKLGRRVAEQCLEEVSATLGCMSGSGRDFLKALLNNFLPRDTCSSCRCMSQALDQALSGP